MADNRNENSSQQTRPMKKADVILEYEKKLSAKTDELLKNSGTANDSLQSVLEQLAQSKENMDRLGESILKSVDDDCGSIKQELKYLAMQNASIFEAVSQKVQELREIVDKAKTAAPVEEKEEAQVEEVQPAKAQAEPELDYDLLADKIAQRIPAPQVVTESGEYVQPVREELDYDLLVDKLVARMPVQEVAVANASPVQYAEPVIDYDVLADKLASRMPSQEIAVASAAPVQYEPVIDYDVLAEKVAGLVPSNNNAVIVPSARVDVDADELADKVVSRIPVQESVSPDYIAARVAEQLVLPKAQAEVEIDYEALAEKVAEKLHIPETKIDVDSEYVAEKVAEKINATGFDNEYIAEKIAEKVNMAGVDSDYIATKVAESIVIPEHEAQEFDYEELASKVAEKIEIPESGNSAVFASAPADVNVTLNEDELADAIALKVGSLKAENFEILVDDDGCKSISEEITNKLNYEIIANAVADKLREVFVEENSDEPDYEEMAARISEKITVAGINEDAIADKAAAVLSNYLPEYDGDEIADKVAEQVISALPSVDHDALTESISARLIESQQDNDYEIVLDEDGIDKVSETVSEKVYMTADERFNAIDREIAEIKAMLEKGVVAVREETATATAVYEEPYVVEETLVTVSDLIKDEEPVEEAVEEEVIEEYSEEPEEVVEETVEEPAEEIEEELLEEPVEEEVIEEPVEESEEQVEEPVEEVYEEPATEAEEKDTILPTQVIVAVENEADDDSDDSDDEEESEESEGGVDFANMMRYNRSFIARIIQSTDEQKKYYGAVRNALLSYRKVNSNIAWGAERFHKGRETIARFKIRGKTLVLYLALDPVTHEYSVYHHKDVSSNKSLHGTPMMIKVKSPLGVKKAVRLIDEMLEARDGVKRNVPERDYAAMYPYESIEELIEDGLVKDVNKK